ncbi:type VI secretion system baseplate subunit TssK [Cysteiniphilum sp. JM-1]|uniref:type VI secretion system baseplate subunit TssK n=1 Tax=Cysteiniphilum sp. JM-1 TaxID=2610891 RepID=UPI001248044D|nr:type VI secretion system baseplate subunit TssK [Cysteiniphilum sp. JM-1]
MAAKVHWQDGALLSAKYFITQDMLGHQYVAQALQLPYQMQYGILSLKLDTKLLSVGELKIDELALYTQTRLFFELSSQHNALHLSLTDHDDTKASIFVNVTHQTHIADIPTLRPCFHLSFASDPSAVHSIKVCELHLSSDGWQLSEFTPPLLSCNSTTFLPTLHRLEKILISLKHLIQHYQHKSHLYPLLGLMLFKLEDKLQSITQRAIHYHPFELYTLLKELCFLLPDEHQVFQKNTLHMPFEFYAPHKCFQSLFNTLEAFLNKPIKQQFIELKLEGEYFTASHLASDFLAAKQFFLVVKKPSVESIDLNPKFIKLSAISRNKHINQMSLSGVQLEYMPDSGIHQLNNPLLYKTYRLSPGQEWDYILSEKNLIFQANTKNETYQFFIYYR